MCSESIVLTRVTFDDPTIMTQISRPFPTRTRTLGKPTRWHAWPLEFSRRAAASNELVRRKPEQYQTSKVMHACARQHCTCCTFCVWRAPRVSVRSRLSAGTGQCKLHGLMAPALRRPCQCLSLCGAMRSIAAAVRYLHSVAEADWGRKSAGSECRCGSPARLQYTPAPLGRPPPLLSVTGASYFRHPTGWCWQPHLIALKTGNKRRD